jgi:hypothetical protein
VMRSPLNVAENESLSIRCSVKFASLIGPDHSLLFPQLIFNLPRDTAFKPNITTVTVDGNVISTIKLRIPAGMSDLPPISCGIDFSAPTVYIAHRVQLDYIMVSTRPGKWSCCYTVKEVITMRHHHFLFTVLLAYSGLAMKIQHLQVKFFHFRCIS